MDKPIYQRPIVPPVNPVAQPKPARTGQPNKAAGGDFQAILNKEVAKVTFSSHAQQRLEMRNIRMTEAQLGRLEDAVAKAQAKGSKHALVVIDSLAFVVSVTNSKVVTAIDGPNVKENVFTNIDSAVIM